MIEKEQLDLQAALFDVDYEQKCSLTLSTI